MVEFLAREALAFHHKPPLLSTHSVDGMREHGYIDGQNVNSVERWAEGRERAFS